MDLYPTADDKRQMGESVLQFSVRAGMEWLERAEAQDAGVLDDYKAALKEWEARKPRARDFVPFEVRRALKEREAAELKRTRAEAIELWGPLLSS
jgi:hypothetical protein